MALDLNKLAQALRDPAITGKSDADAAAALSVPTLTLRTEPITYSTAGLALGALKAIGLTTALTALAAGTSPLAGPAKYVDALLSGPGFSASNPDVQTIGAEFVANSILSQADFTALLNTTSYRCGAVVTASDVATARAKIATDAAIAALRNKHQAGVQAAATVISSGGNAAAAIAAYAAKLNA